MFIYTTQEWKIIICFLIILLFFFIFQFLYIFICQKIMVTKYLTNIISFLNLYILKYEYLLPKYFNNF